VCPWCRSSLSQRPLCTRYCHLRSSASAICSDWYSTGFTCPDCNWTTKFRSQRTSHREPSGTTVIGPVRECLQAGAEDALVLDRPAPLRRLPDSGAGYKYPDLLTYLLTYVTFGSFCWWSVVAMCLSRVVSEVRYSTSNNGLPLKSGLGVIHSYWKCHYWIDRPRLPISLQCKYSSVLYHFRVIWRRRI